MSSLARIYLLHLLHRDQAAAADVVLEARREGKSIAEVLETVILPALIDVRAMWREREATVSDDHYCTASTHMIIAQLSARAPREPENGLRVACAAPGHELADVAARGLVEIFTLGGWSAEAIAAASALDTITASAAEGDVVRPFDLVCLSVGSPAALAEVRVVVDAIRRGPAVRALPIVATTVPFPRSDLAQQVIGADAVANDADALLHDASRLGLVGASRPHS